MEENLRINKVHDRINEVTKSTLSKPLAATSIFYFALEIEMLNTLTFYNLPNEDSTI